MIIASNPFSLFMYTELIKLKRTSALWLTLAGAALLPAAFFIGYLNRIDGMLAAQGNPWTILFAQEWRMLSFLLLLLYVILVTSLLIQVEYKARGWKHLLILPVKKSTIFIGKLVMIFFIVLSCYLLFIVFTLLAGYGLNLIYPGLKFFKYQPDYATIITSVFKSFISILGIMALQYWLNLRFKNFILPIGIGLAGVILSAIIINHWKYDDFFVYAQPALSWMYRTKTSTSYFLARAEWASILFFSVLIVFSYIDFTWKRNY